MNLLRVFVMLWATLEGAQSFVIPTIHKTTTTTALQSTTNPTSTGFDSFKVLKGQRDMPSGEEQRKYRRTVYTHNDWKKHRSQDRFIFYLVATIKSGVYKNLGREVLLATTIATFVVLWNALVAGYVDYEGVKQAALFPEWPKLGIPLTAFTLTSPSLGLLLVFRTNTSYQRWDEARKNWGSNINRTRDLNRQINAFYDSTGVSPEQRQDDLKYVALCTWSFVRAMKRHLSPEEEDELAFCKELYEKLPKQQAEMIIAAAHRPNRALQDLSYAIDDCPMHFLRKNQCHQDLTQFEDNLGSSERLLTSPVPVFYSRHLARFLAIWLFLLPFGVYDSFAGSWNHVALIPATTVISVFLLGIEELGVQLEEPFTILPMQAFCDKIYNWCMEISTWSPGDNGRPMKAVKPEHAFFTDDYTTSALPPPPPPVKPVEFNAPPKQEFNAPPPLPPSSMADLQEQWAALNKSE